ncbi:MAG: thioredoxin family protein [bacterium]
MTTNEKKDEGSACGCRGGSCCRGSGKWIWIILAFAVAGVLVAKNSGKKQSLQVVPAMSQEKVLPLLVDLGAGKCIPCKMMAPILEDLKKTLVGKLEVQFIDVWQNPEAGKKYGINVIPTQIFYDAQGKELFRHEGFFGKEDILAKWKEFGVSLNL